MTRNEVFKIAKPILFNTEMVKAILDGRKTVTRRPIKMKYGNTHIELRDNKYGRNVIELQNNVEGETFGKNPDGTSYQRILAYRDVKPPFKVGNILYVRETWNYAYDIDGNDQIIEGTGRYLYAADNYMGPFNDWVMPDGTHRDSMTWCPSIHMPKEAARIFLRVTDVSVAKLQDIITGDYKTPVNIFEEGLLKACLNCTHHNGDCKDFISDNTCRLVDAFINLCNSTIKKSDLDKYCWDANPWVWVIRFERVEVQE